MFAGIKEVRTDCVTGASQYHIIANTDSVSFNERVYTQRRDIVGDAPMAAHSATADQVDGVPLHAEAWNGFLEPGMEQISKQ